MPELGARLRRLTLRGFAMGSIGFRGRTGRSRVELRDPEETPNTDAVALEALEVEVDIAEIGQAEPTDGVRAARTNGGRDGEVTDESDEGSSDLSGFALFLTVFAVLVGMLGVPAALVSFGLEGLVLILASIGLLLTGLGVSWVAARLFFRFGKPLATVFGVISLVFGLVSCAAAATVKLLEPTAHITVVSRAEHGLTTAARLALTTTPIALSISGTELAILGKENSVQVLNTTNLDAPAITHSTPEDARDVSISGSAVALVGAGRGWTDHLAGSGIVPGKTKNFGMGPGNVVQTGLITWMTNVTWEKVDRYATADSPAKPFIVPGQPTAICAYPTGGVVVAADDVRNGIGYLTRFAADGRQIGGRVRIPPGSNALLAAFGRIWVVYDRVILPVTLMPNSPLGGEIGEQIFVAPGTTSIAADEHNLVTVSNDNNVLERIDPKTGVITAKLPVTNPSGIVQAGPSSFFVTTQATGGQGSNQLLTVDDHR